MKTQHNHIKDFCCVKCKKPHTHGRTHTCTNIYKDKHTQKHIQKTSTNKKTLSLTQLKNVHRHTSAHTQSEPGKIGLPSELRVNLSRKIWLAVGKELSFIHIHQHIIDFLCAISSLRNLLLN